MAYDCPHSVLAILPNRKRMSKFFFGTCIVTACGYSQEYLVSRIWLRHRNSPDRRGRTPFSSKKFSLIWTRYTCGDVSSENLGGHGQHSGTS